jgi:preprotein translocase subunit YajC
MQQYTQWIFFAVVIVGFYLLLVRPQQQQAKRQREMVASLSPGDEVVTIGGIYGTVVSAGDDRIRMALADGSELEIAPRAVSAVVPALEEADDDEMYDEEDEPPMENAVGEHEAQDSEAGSGGSDE